MTATAWKPGPGQNAPIHGYRLCSHPDHQGRRWLPVSYFPPRQWLPNKTAPLYYQPYCHACRRRSEAQRRSSLSPRQSRERGKRRRARYHDKVDPRLDARDFCGWVQRLTAENSVAGLASAVGVSARRVSTFAAGSYVKNGKRYEIKRVRLSTVEKFCDALRENIRAIYPDL